MYNDRGHGPDSAVPGPGAVSARSLTRPLCATTGGRGPDSGSSWTRCGFGKVVDTSVVCNDRGYGPDSAVLGQGVAMPVVFTTGAHGSRRAENVWRRRRCSSALLGTSL